MDTYGDHALPRELSALSLQGAAILWPHSSVRICDSVEPPHLRLKHDDSSQFGCVSGWTLHADTLLYFWRGNSHYSVDFVGVLHACGGWRDATLALASVD